MRLAIWPVCSWVEIATRRSLRPILPIGMGDERHDDGGHERQDRVDPQHRGDQRDDRRDLAQEHGGKAGQRLLDEGEIGGEALGQRGRALAPDLGEIGLDHVAVERRLHVGLDPRHDPVGQDREREQREALHGGDRDHEERRQQRCACASLASKASKAALISTG